MAEEEATSDKKDEEEPEPIIQPLQGSFSPFAARVGDLTVTGDPITGPGAPTVLIMNLPAARVGDLVSGTVCTGSITLGSATVLIANQPAARVGSQVTGTNPTSGAPVTTAVMPPGAPTVMIGG